MGSSLLPGQETAPVVQGVLQIFGGVEAPVAPGGLLTGKEIFDAAYHAVVAAVLESVAMAG